MPRSGSSSGRFRRCNRAGIRCPHHLFGDAVCLLLVFVSSRVDRWFRLDYAGDRRLYGNAAEIESKAR